MLTRWQALVIVVGCLCTMIGTVIALLTVPYWLASANFDDKAAAFDIVTDVNKDIKIKPSCITNDIKQQEKKTQLPPSKWQNFGARMLPRITKSPQYTSHYCFFGEQIEVFEPSRRNRILGTGWTNRICVFVNLGWDGTKFIYYRDPAVKEHTAWGATWGWTGSGRDTPVMEPPKQLLDSLFLTSSRIRFVDGPMKAIYNSSSMPLHMQPCLVLTRNTCVASLNNLGHELADNVWVPFGSMVYTGMLALDNHIVYLKECTPQEGGMKIAKIASTLSPKVTWLKDVRPGILPLVVAGDDSTRLFIRMQVTMPNGHARTFRDRAIDIASTYFNTTINVPWNNDVLDNVQDRRTPRIGIRHKSRRHAILNEKEILIHLRSKCPMAHVSLLKFETMTASEELKAVAELDLYITPSGGGSWNLAFLRDGATAIITNVCWPGMNTTDDDITRSANGWQSHDAYKNVLKVHGQGNLAARLWCVRVENYLWDRFSHFHKIYYMGVENVNVINGSARIVYQGSTPLLTTVGSQFSYSYDLNLKTVEEVVRNALTGMGLIDFAVSV